MRNANFFLGIISIIAVFAITACSSSSKPADPDGTGFVTNKSPALSEFLPLCSAPTLAGALNSFDFELNHYLFDDRRFVSGFNAEQGFVYFEIDTLAGTASPVQETTWLSHLNNFGQAERIGNSYIFKGFPSIENSGLFIYDAVNETQTNIPQPANQEILSLGESLVVGDLMYFSAEFNQNEPLAFATAAELWRFDHATSTLHLIDVTPEPEVSSFPENFKQVGSTLFFNASTDVVSNDLFVLDTNTDVFFSLSERTAAFVDARDPIVVGSKLYFLAYLDDQRERSDLFEYDPLTQELRNVTSNLSDQAVQIIGGFLGFRADSDNLYWVRTSARNGFGPRVFSLDLSTLQITGYDLVDISMGAVQAFAVSDNRLVALLEADVISDLTGEASVDFPDAAVLDLTSADIQLFDLLEENDGQANGLEIYDGKFYFSAGSPFTDDLGFTDNRYNLWRMDLNCS